MNRKRNLKHDDQKDDAFLDNLIDEAIEWQHTRIFVFGSNREGRHGAGAAREAVEKWGAKYGQADGRQGNAYAIVTTELREDEDSVTIEELKQNILRFIHYAQRYPDLEFYVTPVGTGRAGFSRIDVLPMFEKLAPKNCILTWKDERYAHLTK
jgi:hypothetical protein